MKVTTSKAHHLIARKHIQSQRSKSNMSTPPVEEAESGNSTAKKLLIEKTLDSVFERLAKRPAASSEK